MVWVTGSRSKSKPDGYVTFLYTVNVFIFAIYCKRGYFHWGEISRNCWQELSGGGNFHDISPVSLIKSYRFYFPVGEIFAKMVISRKTRKLPPHGNFHVYSIWNITELEVQQQYWVMSCDEYASKSTISMCILVAEPLQNKRICNRFKIMGCDFS